MDTLRWINFILDWIIIITLIYMMLVPIPEETKALQECSEKMLCKKNEDFRRLNPEICNNIFYDINFTIP